MLLIIRCLKIKIKMQSVDINLFIMSFLYVFLHLCILFILISTFMYESV